MLRRWCEALNQEYSEKTLRESAQPTSLESRVAPGVMEYARSPKLPPLVFEAQTCAKDSTYVGVDVVRCRRNGLANAPFPLPILCPADGVEPVDAAGPGLCRGLLRRKAVLPQSVAGWYPKVSLAAMLDLGVCRWDHIVLGISARSHVDAATLRRALERMDAAWPEGEEHMAKLRPVGAQRGGGLQRAQQQQQAGRRGRGLFSGLRLRGGHGVGLHLLLSNGT